MRDRRHGDNVFLRAFDLIELDADDLRRDPLVVRKATVASVLARAAPGLRFNEHLDEEDGPLVFAHACKLGLEGIVSKRRDSPYSSGRSRHWIKSKNPQAPAVKREAEEDWAGDPLLACRGVPALVQAPFGCRAQGWELNTLARRRWNRGARRRFLSYPAAATAEGRP
jgi:hypothetical protein